MMKMPRAILVLILLGLLSAAQVSVMDKKSDKLLRISTRLDEKHVPLMGVSGPFGPRPVDSLKKPEGMPGVIAQGSSESEEFMSEITGNLSFIVVRDPKSFFEGLKEPDHYLNIDLNGDEWSALFYDVLNCPKANVEPFSSGEDPEQWRERYRLKFQQSIPDYPMLSQIWDIYNYANYRPEEIAQLREECLKVQTNTSNENGLAALAKLVAACDEASKLGSGLLFVPD
jgi:hypothetical protein